MISAPRLFARAVGLLAREKWLALGLAAANGVVALIHIAEPVLFGRVVDALGRGGDPFALIALWAGLGLVGIAAGVTVAVLADRLAHRRRLEAMAAAFERAMQMPIAYHAERGTGSVVRDILAGTEALFWFWLGLMRDQFAALVGILALVPTALSIDARLAAILGGLAVVFVIINIVIVHKTGRGQSAVERYHSDVYGRVGDVIANVGVVQSYNRIQAEMAEMGQLMRQVLAAQYPVLTWWGLLTVLTKAAGTITMVAIFAVGATLAGQGTVSVGEIVSFVAFAALLIGSLDQLSGFCVRSFQQVPTLRSYFNLCDRPPSVRDAADARPLAAPIAGEIRFEGVTFRYGPAAEGGAQGVFDLDFTVPPGRTLALVGPTGAGKTTTLALLQRVRALDGGRILIDGQDIASVTGASLNAAIAVVFQDAGLFNRSIADNLRLGRPGASDAELEAAARAAEAHEFIRAKPGGYGYVIGERGQFLSGGERQRLAIARAILKDAPILILDEATSALDSATEARIQTALDRLRRGRTTLVIAHRLSTVAAADEILVLAAGRIAARGRYDQLLAENPLFAALVRGGEITD